MLSGARIFVAPAYLLACLVLGGSAQGIWQNMILQLIGTAIIARAALERSDEPLPAAARQLLMLAVAAIAVVGLQMVPLPSGLWSRLGPRADIAADFHALAIQVPAEPLSLTPSNGLNSLLGIIPPLAIFCAMVRLKAYRSRWLVIALIMGTVAGVALGALQVTSANPLESPWYFYEDTNWGRGVGFFANADHMATLLLITIPFLTGMIAAARRKGMQRYSATIAAAAGVGLVVLVGLALNGSLAGYGLALPVIAASMLIIVPPRSHNRSWIVVGTVLLLIAGLAALETTQIDSGIGTHATSAAESRAEILSTTSRAAGDFMPFGSGLGSFRSVYHLYERPDQVTTTYVVHAHNDYAEIVLELGFAGVVLILLFLAWWATAVWRVWRSAEAGPFARAATIASAAVLVHSLVDFPLRTGAIAAAFGMSLALVARTAAPARKQANEFRQTRHVVI